MFCRQCGKPVPAQAVMCINCGCPPKAGSGFCGNCGAPCNLGAAACPHCGASLATAAVHRGEVSPKSQAVTFVLAALLGMFGADRFYLGDTGLAVLKLVTCGGCGIWALIDTIITGIGNRTDAQGRPLVHEPDTGTPDKSQATAFVLSLLLGAYGIDRFYLGYTGLGVLKLVTCGGCGVWSIIDYYMIGIGTMKDAQGNSLRRV